jgi:hypothetical protein
MTLSDSVQLVQTPFSVQCFTNVCIIKQCFVMMNKVGNEMQVSFVMVVCRVKNIYSLDIMKLPLHKHDGNSDTIKEAQ